MFRRKYEKYKTFTVPIEKEVTRIDKNGKEITKNISYILQFIQVHYQILLIIFLKEFIELNVYSDLIMKNVKHVELNISTATVFWNTQILKMIL